MYEKKVERLKAKGWAETSVQKFLDLADREIAYIELKLNLSSTLREKRLARSLTQAQFASMVQSSQSRVSKMERGDPSISIDLLVRSLLGWARRKRNWRRRFRPDRLAIRRKSWPATSREHHLFV